MGILWFPQVRLLHLALLAIAGLTLVYVYVLSSTPVIISPTPAHFIHNYTNGLLRSGPEDLQPPPAVGHSNETKPAIIASSSNSLSSSSNVNRNATTVSDVPSSVPVAAASQSQPAVPDLTRGVAAEIIYEAGHNDPSFDICPNFGKDLTLLIAITSAPSHISARMAIRQTWGHYSSRRDIAITFMLGTTSNATLLKQIKQEEYLYGDIITGKFIDTYDNLTLKTISMLEWVDNYCPKVSFVLKTDDDMFINVSRLLLFISKHKPEQRVIYGRLAKKWKPIRNKKSKYYISPQQYRPPIFPDFTTGPAYLMPGRLAKELYSAALNHTYFKLEDVFVTGIVASSLKIKRVHVPEFLNKRISFTACSVQRGISIHMVKGAEQYDLWKKLQDGLAKCK
ncbi:beta-1,3-galactosyltransferase 5-like isoform X2 [Atheta coriaria]